jgi:hypothetical protein
MPERHWQKHSLLLVLLLVLVPQLLEQVFPLLVLLEPLPE